MINFSELRTNYLRKNMICFELPPATNSTAVRPDRDGCKSPGCRSAGCTASVLLLTLGGTNLTLKLVSARATHHSPRINLLARVRFFLPLREWRCLSRSASPGAIYVL